MPWLLLQALHPIPDVQACTVLPYAVRALKGVEDGRGSLPHISLAFPASSSSSMKRYLCKAATLVDVVGSAALVTVSERSGVSLNISVDYLRPGKAGEDVLVNAKVGCAVLSHGSPAVYSSPSHNIA